MDKDERRPDSKYTFPNEEMIRKEEERSRKAQQPPDETPGGAGKPADKA